MRQRITLLTLTILVTSFTSAFALKVPITLTERTGVERKADPVSVGIPIPRGVFKEADLDKFCVLNPKGDRVPAQFKVTGWWWPTERFPDKEKSIRWVLAKFQADVPADGKATYTLADKGKNPAPTTPLSVKDKKSSVVVSTGPLSFEISKKRFRLFESVELNGKTITDTAKTDGLHIEGMDGKKYYSATDTREPPKLVADDYHGNDIYLKAYQHNPPASLRVVVEEAGPMQSIIMIDGVMQAQSAGGTHEFIKFSGAGDNLGPETIQNKDEQLGFRIRIHAYAGKPFVRVFHTIINLKGKSHTNTDQNRYRSAAYIVDAIKQPGRFILEAMELGTTLALEGTPKYLLGGDKVHSGELAKGKHAALYQDSSAGWIWQAAEDKFYDPQLIGNLKFLNVKKGLEKPYYEYSDIHYKILTGQDGCTFMGYRVYDEAQKQVAEGHRAKGWLDVSDGQKGMTTAVRWFWKMFPKALEADASGKVTVGILPRQWGRGHFLDGKIHRTHELLYRFHGPEETAVTEAAVDAFEKPLVAHCGVDWYLETGAVNFFARQDKKNWPNYEGMIEVAVHEGYNPKTNPSFDSSYRIEREKEDCYGWQHFGDTAKRGFRGFSQFEEFDSSRCLLMHFYRTGDPAFFETAEELDRWLMGVPSFGGGYGHQHPERSHNWIQGMIDYYHLTGLPEAGEAVDAMKGYYEFSKNPKDFCWNYNGRNAAYAVNGLRQMFEWTGDSAWLTAANECIRETRHSGRMQGISGFYGGNPGWFMTHVLCHALGRYGELTGDEEAVDWLIGLSGHFKPFSGRCDGGGSSADCYAHATMLTGDRRYMDSAIKTLNDSMLAEKTGPHYRTGLCSSKTWTGAVGGYWQVFFYAAKEWKPEDTKVPGQITDLVAEPGPEPGSVKLTWTNAGDDDKKGLSAKVQIKYAEGEIVEFIPWGRAKGTGAQVQPEWNGKVNFWHARNLTGEPKPEKSGQKQTWIAKGLPTGKVLHFAMCAHDAHMNRGKPSNSVSVTVP